MIKMPRIIKSTIFGIGVGIYLLSLLHYPVYSNVLLQLQDEITKKEQEIAEKETVLQGVERRIKEISSSNYSLSQKINLLNEEISLLEEDIEKTEEEIEEKVKGIEEKQGQLEKTKILIDDVSGDLYIQSRYKLVNFFLNGVNWSTIVESMYIKKGTISVLKKEVEKIGGEFSSLAESKAELDREKKALDRQKEGLDEAYKLLAEEKAKVQAELNKEVATKKGLTVQIGGVQKELSELQNYLMIVRSGGTVITAGSLVATNSLGSYQNFLSVAPSGSFGIFSFGAFTHRNGMSQWGAKARADAGQSVNQILSSYYPGTSLNTGTVVMNGVRENIMRDIPVTGHGTINFEETYLLGIKEVPEDWPIEVLKAQAIAARTYAVRYTNNGRSAICTTQSCQVFNLPLKTGRWVEAVNATRGVILANADGTPALTQYAAVHGGWVNNVGWDTTNGNGEGDWVSRAWDNLSGTTWFYRNWFDYNTVTGSYTPCSSHPNPWLTQEEMADIINAYKYWTSSSSARLDERFISIDCGVCFNRNVNPYSMAEMRSLVSNPVTSISAVYVSNSGGSTQSIVFETNAGRVNIDPYSFKKVFSLRAPGHYSIPQKDFSHFNIVMR
ncbi:MAG: SpoIID/LytB domain-containing protein [Candidatus Dojkabacteria bacterium]